LASDTPAASTVAGGATNHVFAKMNFAGGENTTVSSIVVTRAGLAEDNDFTSVKLWDGGTQLGGTQALNTTTHKATFTGLGWVVPAGTTKVLTITGTLDVISANATTGNIPTLGIASASDVSATTAVSGTFPAYGNGMTIGGIDVGNLNVTARVIPADSSPVAGATEVEIASWTLAAVTEGMSVHSFMVTQTGSASATDVSNIKLKVGGAQVGPTVVALAANGTAVFDLSSSPYSIDSGVSKIFYLYADLSSGIVTGSTTRTVDFEVTETADVTVFGSNSGGSITITTGSQAVYTTQSGVAQTIGQGTVPTVALNGATNPSAQAFVRGMTQQLFSAFRFSNGVSQDVRVSRLRLNLLGTGADSTDVSNVTLYQYDEATGVETQVGSATNFVGTVATYGADGPGLDAGVFDIAKSKNVVIHVRADVSTSAAWTGIEFALNEVKLDGIQSAANMTAMTVTSFDGNGEVVTHSAHSLVGTLAVAKNATNPAAQNVAPGTNGYTFGTFDFTMSGEDAVLSTLIVDLCDAAACTNQAGNTTAPAELGDFTNVQLWDGSTLLGTVASPTITATFSLNLTLVKDEIKTLTVKADVPTTAATDWANTFAAVGIDRDTTITGVSSTATVADVAADTLGNIMTAAAETLTVAFQAVPATTVVVSSSGIVISRPVFTAGTAGDIRISSLKFSLDDVTAINGTSAANTSLGTLGLYDGSTLLKSATITDGTPDTITFSGLSVSVPSGTQKVLEVKASALIAGTFFTGFLDLTATVTDVIGTGLVSNTTIYGTGTNADDSGGLIIAAEGTLNVSVDAASPSATHVAVGSGGTSDVDFAKFRFAANNEAIDMEQIVLTLAQDDNTGSDNNDVPNFASVRLYDGATAVSAVVYPTGDNDAAARIYTFTFSPHFRIPKDGYKVLTLKADLNGTGSGANSSTTPRFHIADVAGDTDGSATSITARGVGSAQRVTSSATGTNPETATNVSEVTIVKSKPVFALCTASNCSSATPSGALIPGTMTVLRFNIAAVGDDVVFDTNSNIRLTIAESGGAAANRNVVLYEVGKTTALQTVIVSNMTSSTTINFSAMASTISAGTSKEYYVTADLTDYATTGETFRLSIESAAADVSYNDGVTADVTNSPVFINLPITGGTFLK